MKKGTWFTEERYSKILEILKDRRLDPKIFRRDFIARRICWRAKSLGIDPGEYVDSIERLGEKEIERLIRDLSIKVTSFFRNPEVWYELEERIIPKMLEKYHILNVWSAGCATGEEAYSIGVAALRGMQRKGVRGYVHIIGSDVDCSSINVARSGVYPAERISEIPERYRGYFKELGDHIRPIGSVRALVEFKCEDIFRAPYPKEFFHIILLRNVLIYVRSEIKEKLLRRVVNRLKPEGFLVLGKSEVILPQFAEELEVYNLNNRIYRRRRA